MCLIVESPDTKPSVATTDIEVYKVVRINAAANTMMSPYQFSPVSLEVEYKLPNYNPKIRKGWTNPDNFILDIGFHSFKNKKDAFQEASEWKLGVAELSEIHLLTELSEIHPLTWEVVSCIIPKGSLYFEGKCENLYVEGSTDENPLYADGYVSDTIIYKEFCYERN